VTAVAIVLGLLCAGLIWAGFTDTNLIDELRAALNGQGNDDPGRRETGRDRGHRHHRSADRVRRVHQERRPRPRLAIAGAVVGVTLAATAEVAPSVAKAAALLMLTTAVLLDGSPAITAIARWTAPVMSTKARLPHPAAGARRRHFVAMRREHP
jgi:hypothetical protein